MLSGLVTLPPNDAERSRQIDRAFNVDHVSYRRQELLELVGRQISANCEDLMRRILTVKQGDRLTALQVIDHPFFDDIRGNYEAALAKIDA
jgi:hypothetical protein